MRLTLRTLLAFMDDILEPQDQEDLARQIEESEKGTELIHRTRDAMRRLRLGAPPVLGQGMELDPNFTSEYLDSTLSSEQMTDYQQVCLDSDVHLAEVASCHHILTMVLGEPAEIDPDMRRRMYSIPQRQAEQVSRRLDAPHAITSATTATPPAVPDAPPATSLPHHHVEEEPMTEVPDYLRAGSRARANKLLVAGLAILVLGTLGFFSFGPNGWLVGKNNAIDSDPQPAPTSGRDGRVAPPGDATAPVTPADTPPLDSDTFPPAGEEAVPPSDMASLDTEEGETTTPPDGSDLPDLGFDETTPPAVTEEPATATPDVATGSAAPPITLPADPESSPPPVAAGETSPETTPPVPADTPDVASPDGADQPLLPPVEGMLPDGPDPAVATPDATNVPGEGLAPVEPATPPSTGSASEIPIVGPIPATPPTEATPAPTTPTEVVPPPAGPLGTLTSPKDILLRYDDATDQWMRMRVNTSVGSGARLKSLPTYRPSIALTTGLRVELADGTMVGLDRGGEGKWIILDLAYGRLMLVNTGMDPVLVELRVGETSRLVEISPARIVAIDIARPFLPGQSPDVHLGVAEGMVYVPQGGVVWTIDGAPTPIEDSAQWDWNAGPAEKQPFDERVTWLNGQQLDLLDRNASWRIEQNFDTERPAGEQLLEAYEQSRRREEKVLLAKSAIHVGQFVPFVNSLADSNQHSNWDSHITELRAAMARSPQLAERVHQTLLEQRGTVPGMADDLFEMLRGYSHEDLGSTPEEVKAGVLRKLIGWLNHDRLEYRVLAFHNLRQLTGGKSFLYSPAEASAERRARSIRRWEQMLEDNELVPVETAPVVPAP